MADEPKKVPKRSTTGIAPPVRVPIRKPSGDIIPNVPQNLVSIRPKTPVSEDIRIVPRSHARREQIVREEQRKADRAALADWQQRERTSVDVEPANPVLREEQLHSVLERGKKTRVKKFAKAIQAAREALAEARELLSEISVEKAIRRLEHEIARAIKADSSFAKADLLAQIGTSDQELEILPFVFFTTVTITPSGGWMTREPRRRTSSVQPITAYVAVNGKPVEVIYLAGRTVVTAEPITQLVPGAPIDGRRVPTSFIAEPSSYSPAVLADYVVKPLLAITFEVGNRKFTIATVLMKGGNVVSVEVPWSDQLAEGEIELHRRLIAPAADPTAPILSEGGSPAEGNNGDESVGPEAGDPPEPAPSISA